VTEEVALRKQAGERQETARETVRRSDVDVENINQQAKGGKGKPS
jgi:stress response protein YsnF